MIDDHSRLLVASTARTILKAGDIGTVGDSYDNAQAASLIGLYKTECVRPDGPWRGPEDLELATLSWVDWFNTARLHSSLGHVHPSSSRTPTTVRTTPSSSRCRENSPVTKPRAVQNRGRFTARGICRHQMS